MLGIRYDAPTKSSNEVRVAINATILQRFLGGGYYFHDDIPLPTELLVVVDEERGSWRKMFQEPLLQATSINEDSSEEEEDDRLFGSLWIRYCAQLAKTQKEFQKKLLLTYYAAGAIWLFFLVIFYTLAFGMLLNMPSDLVFEEATAVWEEVVPVVLIWLLASFWVSIPFICPMDVTATETMKFFGSKASCIRNDFYQNVQQLVDTMAPSFLEQGYHVDYVHDSRRYCPTLIYVRFTKRTNNIPSSSLSFSSSSSSNNNANCCSSTLEDRMIYFQQKARQEYADKVAITRQQELNEKGLAEASICGLRRTTLLPYRTAIRIIMFPLLFFWVVLHTQSWYYDPYTDPIACTIQLRELSVIRPKWEKLKEPGSRSS